MTRATILKLYKDILRYGETLKYTDKGYYRKKVRQIFKENKELAREADIDFQIKKGVFFLQNQRVL